MDLIIRILQTAKLETRFLLRINNPPHLPLVIEDTQINGPRGIPCISVALYAERNGRFACRPEMLFEVYRRRYSIELRPFYYRDDFKLQEGYAVFYTGRILVIDSAFLRFQEEFARRWNEKLESLGYEEAFRKSTLPTAKRAIHWTGAIADRDGHTNSSIGEEGVTTDDEMISLNARVISDEGKQIRSVRFVIEPYCSSCGDFIDHSLLPLDAIQRAIAHVAKTGHIVVLNGTVDVPENVQVQ